MPPACEVVFVTCINASADCYYALEANWRSSLDEEVWGYTMTTVVVRHGPEDEGFSGGARRSR